MRKNWQQKRIKENAWGLHFDRWYFIAPSGNMYFFYRSCYGPTIFVPITYHALATEDKRPLVDTEIKAFRQATGKRTKTITGVSWFTGQPYSYDEVIDDRYNQVLSFIYETEENGGFKDQAQMNQYLANNKEMKYLFSQAQTSVKYDSMP